MILDENGKPYNPVDQDKCTLHIPAFDEQAAAELLKDWSPKSDIEWIMGSAKHAEIRRRWPRFDGICSACGYRGICYASTAHYIMGDW